MLSTDRYQVLKKLGEGGMGEVWLVYDTEIAAIYALKRIRSELCRHKDWCRFEREINHLRSIRHPNVVRLLDWSDDPANTFYTMEYCPQGSLDTLEPQATRDRDLVRRILISILTGLDHLHGLPAPLLHRDLKPQNVLFGADGQLKIADFGLSIAAGDTTLTSSNWGSLGFTAPEQFTGMHAVDQRADLYSAGAIGFYMLTGQPPEPGRFRSRTLGSDGLAQVIEYLIQPNPDDRPRAAAHALKALDVIISHRSNSTGQYGTETSLVKCAQCSSCAVKTLTYEPAGSSEHMNCLACGYKSEPAITEL